jgi:hypothetical protein
MHLGLSALTWTSPGEDAAEADSPLDQAAEVDGRTCQCANQRLTMAADALDVTA